MYGKLLIFWAAFACLTWASAGCNRTEPRPAETAQRPESTSPVGQKPFENQAIDELADDEADSATDSDVQSDGSKPHKPRFRPRSQSAGPRADDPAPVQPPAADTTLVMPQAQFTEAESQTNLVQVGQGMPAVELPDLSGKNQQLSKLLGEKLTVVAFWSGDDPYAIEELKDLGPQIANPFADLGVKVVAINERDTAQKATAAVQGAAADFANLLDAQGVALGAVATHRLPRTYLLDASGKVLWFDIEYSRSTRRDLLQAIRFQLSQG